jgi:CCR4-NOT transcriptional complex subunit CAF120
MSARSRGRFAEPAKIPECRSEVDVLLTSRCIVTSFIGHFTKSRDAQTSPFSPVPAPAPRQESKPTYDLAPTYVAPAAVTSPRSYNNSATGDDSPRPGRERASSRPMSMIQTYQPPLMDVAQDTLPELQPIFTFLNSHGNKLYQEGYFLKLDDQDSCKYPAFLSRTFSDITKMAGPMRIGRGRNVSRNL